MVLFGNAHHGIGTTATTPPTIDDLTLLAQSRMYASIFIVVDMDQIGVMDCNDATSKWNQLQQALRDNTSVTTVTVKVKQLPQSRMTDESGLVASLNKCFQSLAMLPNLVQLQVCGFGRGNDNGLPLDCVTRFLTRAIQLTKLHMTSVSFTTNTTAGVLSIEETSRQLSSAIASHPSLTELRFHDCRWSLLELEQDNDSFFYQVLAGACAAHKLESLTMAPTFPQALGVISTRAIRNLQHGKSLHSLTLYKIENYFMPDDTDNATTTDGSSSPFQVLTHLLASNKIPALQHLSTPFVASCHEQCQAIESVLVSNKSLQNLDLRACPADTTSTNHQQGPHPLLPIALALCEAPCLQQFSLTGPGTTQLPLPLVQGFCQTVQLNYGLDEVTLYDIAVQKQFQTVVQYHCQLNRHGRRQWLQELYQNANTSASAKCSREIPTGTAKSSLIMTQQQQKQPNPQLLNFLSHLAENKDAIYYYLSEMNPSILKHIIV